MLLLTILLLQWKIHVQKLSSRLSILFVTLNFSACIVLCCSPLFTVLQINRKRNTCFPLHFSALPMQEIRLDGFKEWTSLFLRYRCCKNNCEARAWRNLKFWPHCDAVLPQSREELLFVDPMKHLFGHSPRRP